MYNIDSIEYIHIEPSNHCNSYCPQCPRYDNFGKVKQQLRPNHLTIEQIKNIPIDKMKNLKKVYLCGSLGDPLMSPHIDFFFEYFKEQTIDISSNASIRNESWWSKLADHKNVTVSFCIDGIDSETHCTYRRNTSFEKIMRNAEAYITNGGKAEWQFIIFKHNQHQIDEANALSEKMGFRKINFIYSDRFNYNFNDNNKWPVYVDNKIEYYLESPTLQHNLHKEVIETKDDDFYLKPMLQKKLPKIDCEWSKKNKIYVSANALVYPCCWIGYIEGEPKWEQDVFKKCIKDRYDLIDLGKQDLEEIVNGPVYKEYFIESLEKKPHMVCISQCHPKFGKAFNEYANGNTVNKLL